MKGGGGYRGGKVLGFSYFDTPLRPLCFVMFGSGLAVFCLNLYLFLSSKTNQLEKRCYLLVPSSFLVCWFAANGQPE
jgi:hypothetical protein